MKNNVLLSHSGTEGTDQYKSYLQKRKPPRVVKALSGTGRSKKDASGSINHQEDFNNSRVKTPILAKGKRNAKTKSLLKSTSKKMEKK
jgi:hypothetical protein